MRPKIGIALLGHRDYQNDIGLRMASEAIADLNASGIETVFTGSAITDPLSAAAETRALLKEDVHGVVFFLGTWLEAPVAIAAIREAEHLPFAVWGFPMFDNEGKRDSTGSLVAYQVVKGALDRMGYRYTGIIGVPEDFGVSSVALDFAVAAYAAERLKRARIGLVGYASMGMYCGTCDHLLMRRHLGPEIEHIDTYTLLRRAEMVDHGDAKEVVDRIRMLARIGEGITEADLLTVGRLKVALRQLADERHLDAVNVKCQYELSQEYGMTACVPLSLLSDEGVVCGCEGDVLCSVSMLALSLLSGDDVTYADMLDVEDNEVLFSSCGFAPIGMAGDHDCPAVEKFDHPGFDGVLCSFTLKPSQVTFLRIAERTGDYRFQFGLGEGMPSELRQGKFPALSVMLDGSGEDLIRSAAGQHYALAYGDLSRRLEMLADMLGADTLRI